MRSCSITSPWWWPGARQRMCVLHQHMHMHIWKFTCNYST